MTNATVVVAGEEMTDSVVGRITVQREVAQRLLAQVKKQGVSLTGPGGSLSQLTKNIVETTENAELTEYLGREHGRTLDGRERA